VPRSTIADGCYVERPEWARACPSVEAQVRVNRNDPNVAKVMLQIDSGADLTMLPATILALPGIVVADTMKVRGVTGHLGSYEMVKLCFGLGNVRVPSVSVCLVDREVGLLGRDLLDLVVLELDGPNKRWSMSR